KLRAFRPVVFRAQANPAPGFLELGATEKFADELPDQWHAGLATDKNDLVQIMGLQLCIRERTQTMHAGPGDDITREIFKFGTRQFVTETEVRGQEGKRDFDFHVR